MDHHRRSERGQALVLIVFAMIALIGMVALAIDGGNSYSDRRHAQNAADTSALAAGLSKIRNQDKPAAEAWSIASGAGYSIAGTNGYDNNGTSNVVNVNQCTDDGVNCNLPATEDPSNFIRVTITSHVPTYFARVLGIAQMTNSVQALVRAIPPEPTPWYNGNALVSTQLTCHPPAPYDPFTVGGGSVSVVTGAGGVFVNSDCDNAFTASNGSQMSSVSGICVVGGAVVGDTADINPYPQTQCGSQIDLQKYKLPSIDPTKSCANTGAITSIGGNYYATPGTYNAPFPSASPAGTIKLTKGIYCLNNGMNLSSQWNLTTDLDGNGIFDGSDGAEEGVMLYVPHGGITINGGATVHLGAINKEGTDAGIKGYLIYLPPTNNSPVDITGGTNEHFIGTILAPSSLITLNGGTSGDSLDLECQIIGYEIKLTGNGTLNIQYNQGQNAMTWTNPVLELYR